MDLQPTRNEARLWVACLFGFWAIMGLVDLDGPAAALILLALPLVFAVFMIHTRVVSRATGVPVARLFGLPGQRGARRPPVGYAFSILTPSWWKPVLRATGWPVPLVLVALAAALAAGTVLRPFLRS